jgi:hypothetical protein
MIIVAAALLFISGCQVWVDALNVLPPPKPMEQCLLNGGDWRPVVTYDPQVAPSEHDECIIRRDER